LAQSWVLFWVENKTRPFAENKMLSVDQSAEGAGIPAV